MMRLIILLLLILPVMANAAAPAWQIVPDKSAIQFTATQNGAPVTGQFKSFTGEINFDPAQLSTSKAHIVVATNSMTTSYAQIADTLKTPDWFDTKLSPQAVFTSKTFTKTGENIFQANGTLTIRDKTVPVLLTFTVDEYSKTGFHAKGSTTLKRTAFGLGKDDWAKTDEIKDNVIVDFILTTTKKS